jgi:hypothetical protein
MVLFAAAVTAGTALSLTILVGLYRRHRARPPVHHFNMAQHLWQPRKLK